MDTQQPSSVEIARMESDIPSVVAITQRRHTFAIGGFLALMFVVAIMVCRKPARRVSSAVPLADNAPSGPSLPAPMSYPKPVVPAPVARFRSAAEGSSSRLVEARRISPMVIFNKTPGAGNTGPSQPARGEGQGTDDGGVSGVPMPSGFSITGAGGVSASAMRDREWTLAQGKVIDAVLETAVNSDHPGMLRALVSHDVYADSGRAVLLPRGSRLVGQYDSAVARGQNRVFVIWQRAIRPDGVDILLGSAGTDALGRTGVEGDVNNHFFMMFSAATLLSVIGASASTVGVSGQDQNNSLAAYRQSVTQGFNSAAGTVLGQFVQIKPTITVRQGQEVKVFVGRDLIFDPNVLGNGAAMVIP